MNTRLAIRGGPQLRTRAFTPWPSSTDSDKERLLQVLESECWGGEGPLGREFEQKFAARHQALDGVAVTNGTVALLLCLRALGIKPGDEVIVPALTWIATATCVIEANAVPVIVDIDPRTFCIDPNAVRAAITPRTMAIIPVHLYSSMADMDALRALADTHSLAIIEDCAHAHGASFRDECAGSIGTFGSFSFQSSKPMTAGEGGIVIGRDKALLDKIYSQRNCGRHRAERGCPILGGNQRMTEWQAAILLGQLEQLDHRAEMRERAIRRLREKLSPLAGVSMLADQPAVTKRPMYRLAFHYNERQTTIPLWAFIEAVRAEGIPIEPTYQPIYANPLWFDGLASGPSWYGRKVPHYRCPVAERIAHTAAFTLPHHILLGTDQDIDDVAAVFHKVLTNAHEAADMTDKAKEFVKGLLRKTR